MTDTPLTHTDWQGRAASRVADGRHVIGGQRLAARSGATFESINPANGMVLAKVARGEQGDIDLVRQDTRAVWLKPVWQALEHRIHRP